MLSNGNVKESKKITSNYTVVEADEILYVDSTSSAITLTLETPTNNNFVTIKDIGDASVNNITIQGAKTIDGAASYVISDAKASVTLGYFIDGSISEFKSITGDKNNVAFYRKNIIGWQDFADSNTSEASPLQQTNVNGGEVQLTNNNNDTLTDGNTNLNAETTVNGVNDLWSTSSNTIVFKDTGIEKNDLFDIRVHVNISANIISQEFNLRIDFYDDVDGTGNYIFSLREHVSTESLSAGVFRERLVNMDGFVGESILNGSAKIFLEGTKSFDVEVIGFNIKLFKIAR